MKKFFDRLQLWFYLAGFSRIARFIGRWGSPPVLSAAVPESDRPTLPDPEPKGSDARRGPGWSLDEFEVGPLKVINFDPTFNNNQGIDAGRDVAFPTTKYDVN